MANKESFYLGNPQLPMAGTQYEWTPEMISEFKKCSNNMSHFAENHFYITTLDAGKQKIQLYKPQRRVLKSLDKNRFVVLLSARQSGKSTMMTIYALHEVCFNSDKSVMLIANKEQTARTIFSRIQTAYELLPNWLKPGVKEYGKEFMKLENDSSISISTTTSTAARGQSCNVLIIDEMAFIQDNFMEQFWSSVIPIISSSKKAKIFTVSTPNGTGNKFYELYTQAERKENGWKPERIDWWEIPGHNKKWKRDTINSLGGSQEIFDQEFGNKFIETGTSPIDPDLLEWFRNTSRDPEMIMEDGHYKIWIPPIENHIYVIGVDVGEGVGACASVAQILDITDLTNIQQCAVYQNNKIDPFHFASKLLMMSNQWGKPLMLIERNNCGGQVIDALYQTHHYDNIVEYSPKSAKGKNNRLGVYSHTNSKYKGVINMRYWVNSLRSVTLYDIATIHELETFVQYPNGTWKKKPGLNTFDDRVMSLIWALFILEADVAPRYFEVVSYDQQGKPLKLQADIVEDSQFYQLNPIYDYNFDAPLPAFIGDSDLNGDVETAALEKQGWKFLSEF